MAKSSVELIRDLQRPCDVLTERDGNRRERVEDLVADLEKEQAERKAAEQKHSAEVTEIRRELADARQETAVLKKLLDEHIKKVDLADNRRWGMVVLALGAIFSLATGPVVSLTKK